KVVLFSRDKILTYEKTPVKGFMSAMEIPIHLGLANVAIDSVFLIWPDNSSEKIGIDSLSQQLSFTWKKGLPLFDYNKILNFRSNETAPVTDITKETALDYLHQENKFNEFDRDPLLPHMISTEGPALAVADINKDGLEDVFIGAAKAFRNAVFLQQP